MVTQESFDALQAEHALLKNNVDIFHTNYTTMKNDLEAVKAQVAAGEAIIQELRKRTTENNKENDDKRRIANAHLLKGKEPQLFINKLNYAKWVEDLKADLYPTLPELRQFSNFAEEKHEGEIFNEE